MFEEYAGRVDKLAKEATGKRVESKVFNKTQLTKIVHEDNEVMVLHLEQDRDGPVWKQTQWPSRRRSSVLLIFFHKKRSNPRRRAGGGRWGHQSGWKEHFPGQFGP